MAVARLVGRETGLEVHRDLCVIAICEDGVVRLAGRVPGTSDGITSLAERLLVPDRVASEVTGSCWEAARMFEPHVIGVVVVSSEDTGSRAPGRRPTSRHGPRPTPER
jgi:hypothetical protein